MVVASSNALSITHERCGEVCAIVLHATPGRPTCKKGMSTGRMICTAQHKLLCLKAGFQFQLHFKVCSVQEAKYPKMRHS